MSQNAKKSTKKSANEPIADKLERLRVETEWFYGEDFTLDQAAAKYQHAIELTNEIEQDLLELKNRIEIIDKDFTSADA